MARYKSYRIFICHAWDYIHYDRVVEFLDSYPRFHWMNYSIPEDSPLHTASDKELSEGITRQIRPTNCVLVIASMNVPYRGWIQEEILTSADMRKPIVGIIPYGNVQVPKLVQEYAITTVGWRKKSIVKAIRRYSI